MGKKTNYSVLDMDVESNIGKMVPFTKDIGHSICLMVEVDWFIVMETFMKENSKMIKLLEKYFHFSSLGNIL